MDFSAGEVCDWLMAIGHEIFKGSDYEKKNHKTLGSRKFPHG